MRYIVKKVTKFLSITASGGGGFDIRNDKLLKASFGLLAAGRVHSENSRCQHNNVLCLPCHGT